MFYACHFVSLVLIVALSIESVNGGPKREKGKKPKSQTIIHCNEDNFRETVQQLTGRTGNSSFGSSNLSANVSQQQFHSGQEPTFGRQYMPPAAGSYYRDLISQVESSAARNTFSSSSNLAAPQRPTGQAFGIFNSLPNSASISFKSNNAQSSQQGGNQQDEGLYVEPINTYYPSGSQRFSQGRSSKGSKRKGGKQ
ncbi:hypothetical protein niasHT_004515 [Heterodera trifolii]|uniref:VQ domain-containing protein n=1 Tax=Heterodera trifolii TaxID=157864 RepID=A0ABD2LQN9_9BILA